MEKMENNIYLKIQAIRCELQEKQLKKSGANKFAGFKYYTLEDFIPTVNQLCNKYKVFTKFDVTDEKATLLVINGENPNETLTFETPIANADIKGATPIQSLGAIHTYSKRYLYQNVFEIVEGDMLDELAGSDNIVPTNNAKPTTNKNTKKESSKVVIPTIETNPMAEKFNKLYKNEIVNENPNAITKEQLDFLNGCEQRLIDWIKAKMNINSLEELNRADAQVFIDKIIEKRGQQ